MMKKIFLLALIIIIFFVVLKLLPANNEQTVTSLPGEISLQMILEGEEYVLVAGDIYKIVDEKQFEYIDTYYDPNFYEKNYIEIDGEIYRKQLDTENTIVRPRNNFRENFEQFVTINDLIITPEDFEGTELRSNGFTIYDADLIKTRWTTMTIQSPSTPTVSEYVTLKDQILNGQLQFIDNSILPSSVRVQDGKKSIHSVAVAHQPVSKSSIGSELLHFIKGDDFWFSGWFFLEKGLPIGIIDLESTFLLEHSGIRLLFSRNGRPYVELKAFDKPVWRAPESYTVPRDRWFKVTLHLFLDDKNGQVEVWFDDEKIIDGYGRTIPLDDSILNNLEIGISATTEDTSLYFDNITVSDSPIK